MEIPYRVKHPGCYRGLSTALHAIAVPHFVFAVYYYVDFSYKTAKNDYNRFGGSLKYVITWAAMSQIIYNLYSLVLDIVTYMSHLYEPPEVMLAIQAYLKSTFVFPLSCFGTVSFWLFYAISPSTVYYSKELAAPLWLIHMTTTHAMLFTLLDTILCKNDYPKLGYCIAGMFFVTGLYFVWMLIVRVFTKTWIYPVYGKMSFVRKIIAFVLSNVLMLLIHLVGRALNNFLWDDTYIRGGEGMSEPRMNTEEYFLKKALSSQVPSSLHKKSFLSVARKDSRKSQSDPMPDAKSQDISMKK